MVSGKIFALAVVLILFALLFVYAFMVFGTGVVQVYGDEYVEKYFHRDKVMAVNIEISEADWNDMMENAIEEEFHTATVTVNGDVYPNIRIRTKGNSSLMSVARSESNRYSFKINFNGLIKGQTMAGLTQLNLNNGFSDPSYMREYLSYQIFEEMGVATPAFSFAAVHVNGEYIGLYLAVESILEPYLERNFGNITGDLYKSEGNTLSFNGNNKSDYTGLEVKSTRKNADWSGLIKMVEALDSGSNIDKYLDVDAALRYIAVSTALANFDSYQGNFAHNYYLYEQNGIFTILPWDLNMSFGGFSFGGDAASVYIDEPTQGALSSRPLIAKLLANEQYLETYHGYLEQMAVMYLSGGYLEAETSRLYALIADYVKTDPTAFYSFEQFEKSITGSIASEDAENENQPPEAANRQDADNGQGFRMMGGAQGFGNNIPGILELSAAMSESIQKQLRGEIPSTNNGNGMGGGIGMGGGRMPGVEGEPPALEGGGRQPGRMMMPESADSEEREAFMQEVFQEGGLTDELREKARELGIPEAMLETPAGGDAGRPPGGMQPDGAAGAMRPQAGLGDNQPNAEGFRRDQSINRNAVYVSLASIAVIAVAVIAALKFKRRRYL